MQSITQFIPFVLIMGLGMIVGRNYVRLGVVSTKLHRSIGLFMSLGLIFALLLPFLGMEKSALMFFLLTGICAPVSWASWRFHKRVPQQWQGLESDSKVEIFGHKIGWSLAYNDGSVFSYDLNGSIVKIQFPDGSVWEMFPPG